MEEKYGKAICVALYAAFAALAAKGKPLPLISLLGAHTAEYFLQAKAVADEHGISQPEAAANCLAFGFTWWKQIKNS